MSPEIFEQWTSPPRAFEITSDVDAGTVMLKSALPFPQDFEPYSSVATLSASFSV